MKAFVAVRINGPKEARDVETRFAIHGHPTALVVDGEGREVDRIVGYRPLASYTAEIERIARGEGTLPTLKAKAEANPDDVDAAAAYAAKLAVTKPEDAMARLDALASRVHGKDRAAEARVWVAIAAVAAGAGQSETAMKAAERVLTDFADTPAASEVGEKAGSAFLRADVRRALTFFETAANAAKDATSRARLASFTVAVHRRAMGESLAKAAADAGDDAQALNEIAWQCHELHVNVREAVAWARRAVALSNRDPAILDTLANCLADVGMREEAIQTETEAAEKVDGPMRAEFIGNVAKWRAERDVAEEAKWRKEREATAGGKPAAKSGSHAEESEDGEEDEAGEHAESGPKDAKPVPAPAK